MVRKTGYFNHFFLILWGWHRGGNVEMICETLKKSSWVKLTNKSSSKTFWHFIIIHFINNHYFFKILFSNHRCAVKNVLILPKFVCEWDHIYWAFNIRLNILLLRTRHRHDWSFRQIVVPGNPLVFHLILSDGPSLVTLPKLLEGCDRVLSSHEQDRLYKILIRPTWG